MTQDERARERKRRKIINATLKIFSRKGYSPMVLDEIAREAGIAKGTLYLYFKDKEELFHTAVMSVIDDYAERLKTDDRSRDGDPLREMEKAARSFIEYFGGSKYFFNIHLTILTYNLMSNYSNLFEDLMSRKMEFREYLAGLVDRAKQTGQLREDIPTLDLVIGFQGLINEYVSVLAMNEATGNADVDQAVRSVMTIFKEGAVKA
jgi:AcrR family transcriptional regulator